MSTNYNTVAEKEFHGIVSSGKSEELPEVHFNDLIGVTLDDVIRCHASRIETPSIPYEQIFWQGIALDQMRRISGELNCKLGDLMAIMGTGTLAELDDAYKCRAVEQYFLLASETMADIYDAAWDLVDISEGVYEQREVLMRSVH